VKRSRSRRRWIDEQVVLSLVRKPVHRGRAIDGYPADRLMHDIALALMAVQTQTTEVLDIFPTKPQRTSRRQRDGDSENPQTET
jgi:hypothetical protein